MPGDAVSDAPIDASPAIVGACGTPPSTARLGTGQSTAAVAADCAVPVVPAPLSAVTTTRRCLPRSAIGTMYAAVACPSPVAACHPVAPSSETSHTYV